jgi:hypothetical protein
MIVVKLQGGLGNQMFQYAAARGAAKPQEIIYLDHTHLEDYHTDTEDFTARCFELGIFKHIKAKKAGKIQLSFFKSPFIAFKLLRAALTPSIIKQDDNNNIALTNTIDSSFIYLDGYFQSERYFQHIKKEIQEAFTFPETDYAHKFLKDQIIQTTNAVSMHIRRSDYLKPKINAYHGVLPHSYYKQAKKIMEEKIPSPHYYIFSDDPEWCRNNLLSDNSTIVSSPSDDKWTDMSLMSCCKHHIIANSSYSWWGAWLNKNPGKIVIAPVNWFKSIPAGIVPESWIKI